ncbi:MAG: ribosome maturation factor RimM [Pseudomonadota bacterium]
MSDRVCVGAVAGSFGVRGEVRLKSFTADPEAIAAYGAVETEDKARRFDIKITRPVKGGFAAKLSGVVTKDAADALKGTRLYVNRETLPVPEDDEYYHADLIGLAVHDTGGALIGHVKAVLNHGASDLLELRLPGSPKTALLPFTKAVVPTVDIAQGKLVADPPEGWD